MILTIVSVAAFALLFALFGTLRQRAGCSGDCGACRGGSCPSLRSDENHG